MSEKSSEPEFQPLPEAPILRDFAEQHFVPRIMQMEQDGDVSVRTVDELDRALPEFTSYVTDAIAKSKDPELRRQAASYIPYAARHPNPRTLGTIRALLEDSDPLVARDALAWCEEVRAWSGVSTAFADQAEKLAAQARAFPSEALKEGIARWEEEG